MLRRTLTVIAGYVLYTYSSGRSDAQLSVVVRFLFNPTIALTVGFLIGLLSVDHPALTSVIGIGPWAFLVHGPGSSKTISGLVGWLVPVVVYTVLSASAAVLGWKLRGKGVRRREIREGNQDAIVT
jgi:hypothetical protein